MSSQGPTITGTGADDNGIGTVTWTNPTNVQANDSNYATVSNSASHSYADSTVKLVKGGTVQGNNNGLNSTSTITSSEAVKTYGTTSDLWGLTLTDTDVNASNFGAVCSLTEAVANNVTHYLKGTNFGFTIPGGATINGIEVGFSWKQVLCFVRGTKVKTPEGEVRIEKVKVGDIVTCFDEKTGKVKKSKVLALKRGKSEVVHTIRVTNGTVKCTALHRFFKGRNFVEARSIRPGDYLQVLRNGKLLEALTK